MSCLEKRIAPPTSVTLSIAVLYRTVPWEPQLTVLYRTLKCLVVLLYCTWHTVQAWVAKMHQYCCSKLGRLLSSHFKHIWILLSHLAFLWQFGVFWKFGCFSIFTLFENSNIFNIQIIIKKIVLLDYYVFINFLAWF